MQPVCNCMKVPCVQFAWSLHQQFAWNTFNATEIYYSLLISMQNSWQLQQNAKTFDVSILVCCYPILAFMYLAKFLGTKLALE